MPKAPNKNRLAQEETERRHVEEFLRRKGITADVEYRDAPDAVLLVDGRRVGLEHRELTEEDLAANRPNIAWLEGALREKARRLGLAEDFAVSVGVDARAAFLRRRSSVDAMAARLARFAQERAERVTKEAPLRFSIPELETHGFPGLSALILSRLTRLRGGPHAFVSPAFWGPGESSAREAVRAKERRLARYKAAEHLDEVWLLLVTGESWTQATDSVLTGWLQLASEFDAVYLMDTRTGALQRLDEPL